MLNRVIHFALAAVLIVSTTMGAVHRYEHIHLDRQTGSTAEFLPFGPEDASHSAVADCSICDLLLQAASALPSHPLEFGVVLSGHELVALIDVVVETDPRSSVLARAPPIRA